MCTTNIPVSENKHKNHDRSIVVGSPRRKSSPTNTTSNRQMQIFPHRHMGLSVCESPLVRCLIDIFSVYMAKSRRAAFWTSLVINQRRDRVVVDCLSFFSFLSKRRSPSHFHPSGKSLTPLKVAQSLGKQTPARRSSLTHTQLWSWRTKELARSPRCLTRSNATCALLEALRDTWDPFEISSLFAVWRGALPV